MVVNINSEEWDGDLSSSQLDTDPEESSDISVSDLTPAQSAKPKKK